MYFVSKLVFYRCPNMAILDAELSDNEEETDTKLELKKENKKTCSKRILHNVKWEDKLTTKYKGNECYSSAIVGGLLLTLCFYYFNSITYICIR